MPPLAKKTAAISAAIVKKCFQTIEAKPQNNSLIFNEGEAANYLHQKPRTLKLWRRQRGLPHFKVTGKVVLYSRTDLDQWLEQHRMVWRSEL